MNPRILILLGGALFTLSMWNLGHLTTLSGEPDTRWSLILRGAGLGLLFTPINLAAFSSLKGAEIAQGAGLLNLMRQLGGSFGIAVLGTYITNMTAAHRTALVAHLYNGNPVFEQRVQELTLALASKGYSLAAAKQAALAIIDRTVQLQAMTMSYNDAFLLIGLTVVLVSPAVFLLRTPKARPAGADMGH